MELVKLWTIRQESRSLGMSGTFVASILGNKLTGKTVLKAGKELLRAGRGYNNADRMDKHFQFGSIL